ncbi:MAG: ArdC-like ssDNA-binding domain-containing protein [Actinomycetota bacterium]|nr:ArdC-like ssDNA-binding domain-containing protein [Actinomycetota bacterium]
MNDALRNAHERLQTAVAELVSGEDWRRMLEVASTFHRYSFHNHMLILCQRPDATLVAGYRKWLELGRHVRKGEKGIAILAPCKYKTKVEDEDGQEQTIQPIRGFRVVYVFDVSQTEGEPLEDFDALRPRLLDGDAPEGLWDALAAIAHGHGYEVVRHQRRDENGYCDHDRRIIAVRPDVAPAQAVKTLVHELAHALLHGDGAVRSREVKEVEVESVAFVVCDALGLDTGDYSFSYVAGWTQGSLELLKDTADRVVSCAKGMLAGLQSPAADVDDVALAS